MRRVIEAGVAVFLNVFVVGCGRLNENVSDDPTQSEAFEATTKSALSLNDVSILFPVTAARFFERSLQVTDVGAQGMLVPRWVFSQPVGVDRDTFDSSVLRAVSVRIDPCSNLLTAKDDAGCERQVRIVWQGLRSEDGRITQALDFNLHSIYQLDNPTFKTLVSKLRALKASTRLDYSKQPLKPHPAIVAQGIDGAYRQGNFWHCQVFSRREKPD